MMFRLFFLIFFLPLSLPLSAQFQVGHTSITFTDPSRNDRPIPTEIYYPAEVAGDEAPLAAGQFPVIQFGHGFVMVWSAYQHFWETYAAQGYILCFPKTEGTFSPNHTNFAKDLAFLCSAMEAEKVNPTSLFFEHIQSRYCVMGHSMGGGCTILAQQYNPDLIQCVATFAAANTNPSAIAVAPAVSVPSLTFAGNYDCIAPPAQQAALIFQALDTTACKIYLNIDGASHCQFANANTNCNLGEVFSGCSTPPISATAQQDLVNNILLPWLNTYLKEAPGFLSPLMDTLAAENGFSAINNCQNSTDIGDLADPRLEFYVLDNPVSKSELSIQFSDPELSSPVDFLIYDVTGQLVLQVSRQASKSDPLSSIPVTVLRSGTYFIVAISKDGHKGVQKFVKL